MEVLSPHAFFGPDTELGFQGPDGSRSDLALQPGQDGLDGVAGHQPRDEEVHGDRGQRGDQIEDEPPSDDTHAGPSLTPAASLAGLSLPGSRSFPGGSAGSAG